MPPLDLLDNVTSGHLTNPRPERDSAPHTFDGPGNAYPSPLHSQPTHHLPSIPTPQNALPVDTTNNNNNGYSPPPTLSSPPAYRPTPPERHNLLPLRVRHIWNPSRRWLRLVYLDVFFMLLALAATHVIMRFSHVVFRRPQRYFPMTWDPVSGMWYGPVELSYPYSPFVVSVLASAIVIPAVGVAVIVCMQGWVRSFWDANAGLFALFKGLVMM